MSEGRGDVIGEAVYEVREVAAEIKDLKRRAEQYGSATDRLRELSASVESFARTLERVSSGLDSIVAQAGVVVEESARVRAEAEGLASSVPTIVEKIERTELSKGVAEIVGAGECFRQSVEEQRTRLGALLQEISEDRAHQIGRVDAIAASIDRLSERLDILGKAVTDAAAVGTKTEAIATANCRKLNELQNALKEQADRVEALSKRKGLIF